MPCSVCGHFRNQPKDDDPLYQGEIRAAYRREMTNYHPDKVAHLGNDLQELAKNKTQEINQAYEQLTRR